MLQAIIITIMKLVLDNDDKNSNKNRKGDSLFSKGKKGGRERERKIKYNKIITMMVISKERE